MKKEDEFEEDEFEGEETLDPSSDNDSDDSYPSKNLKVERAQYSIFELYRKFKKSPPHLIMDPEFQRKDVWTDRQKSELVESILMGIPLPLLYFTEDKYGNIIVVDGKQRLTALFEFIDNNFELTKLRILRKLKGKRFNNSEENQQKISNLDPLLNDENTLSPKLQSNLEDYQLIAHVIKYPTEDRIKFDIFDRVNRGGTRLNNQEMRNAIYNGKSTRLLKKLSELPIFKDVTKNSVRSERMKDRYLIIRFLSFYLWKNYRLRDNEGAFIDYKSDMNDFIGKTMDSINKMSDKEIENIENIFINTMENIYNILGNDCFRLPSPNRKRPINMGLFEALSYLLSDSEVVKNIELLKLKYNELVNDKDFNDSLINVDNISRVKKRFEIIEIIKQEILNAE